MSTNMGNLEKLGILVIVILVVVVGVVAMTPKQTVDERLYPGDAPAESATATTPPAPEVLEPVAGETKKDDVWPTATKPLPGAEASASSVDPKAAAPAAPKFRTIKVQQGDTLAVIAQRELDSGARFNEILDANPGLTPSKLKKGMEIKIPVAAAAPKTTPPGGPTASTSTPTTTTPTATETATKTYVVKSGDTLSSIAAHEMGGKSKWPELQKANEDVLHGSTALKIGMKLVIPTSGSSSSSVASRDLAPTPSTTETPAPAAAGEREYVVKSGDTLWGIAKAELGGDVKALKAANQDVLKGGDTLKVGMKLKIPAKK